MRAPAHRRRRTALPVLVLALLGAGCFRYAREWELRGELLQQQLTAQEFRVTPAEGLERIQGQVPLRVRACAGGSCRACTRSGSVCFELQADAGVTRVVPAERLSEESTRALWQPLDADSLTRTSSTLAADAEARLVEEEARFVPRFGATFGVLATVGTRGDVSVGARAGLRRWHEMHVLSTWAVEYAWFGSPSPHQLALLIGAEISRWGEFSERVLGAPWASLSLFAAPTLRLGGPAAQPGFRAGVGVHLNQYSGGLAVPFFVELGGAGVVTSGGVEPAFFFAVGFGL